MIHYETYALIVRGVNTGRSVVILMGTQVRNNRVEVISCNGLLKAEPKNYVLGHIAIYLLDDLLIINGEYTPTDADICDDLDDYFDLRKLKRDK